MCYIALQIANNVLTLKEISDIERKGIIRSVKDVQNKIKNEKN